MGKPSPWIQDGPTNIRFRTEQGHLVREEVQPLHKAILADNYAQRQSKQQRSFLGGHKVASVPVNDLPAVRLLYPALFGHGADADLKRRELIKFSRDPAMSEYLIRRA